MRNKIRAYSKRPFAVYLSILALTVLSIWIYLWVGLSAYEAGIPQNLMNGLVEEIQTQAGRSGNCRSLLIKYDYTSAFGSVDSEGKAFADAVSAKDVSYKRIVGWKGEGDMAYSVLADGEEIAIATLSAKEGRGVLGLALYEISGLSGVNEVTVLANPNVTVYVQDVELDLSMPSASGVIPKELQALAAYPQNTIEVPQYNEYYIDGLFTVPEITGATKDGTRVEGVFIQEDYLMLSQPASETLMADITEIITVITQKYSYYMSDDLGWDGFKGHLISTAPIYDRLRTLEVYWYTLHDSTRFENMEFSDFFLFSDGLISVRLTYDYIVVGQGKVTTYATDLTYYLATDADGQWRVAEMIVN